MRPALDVLSTEDLEEYEIYFYPMAAGRAKQRAPGDTVLLVCADVSFAAGLVRKTTRVLVGAILELSKLDSGMVTPRRSVNDVREILYDAMQIIMPAADEKQVAVAFELPSPLLFSCDEEMLFSIFSNLMTNCVRYAKSDIFITAVNPPDKRPLEVFISNDGDELSEEDRAHMFERFYKGAGGQTGIGPALSQEFMRLHGGELSVSVEKGRTVYWAALPRIRG